MIGRAIAAAGASDFGAPGIGEGLERTLNGLAQVPLTDDARVATEARIVEELSIRLRIEQWYMDHPEPARQEVEGPVLVVGMPRTGTTATVAMLAQDERFRFLRGWEGISPLPSPVAGEEETDPRVIAARAAASAYAKPELHLHDPDGPEEDMVFIAGLNMRAYHGSLPMPRDFLEWWIGDDFASTYAFHARVLRLLQSRRPPNLWLLKAPVHLFKLEAFAAQYPDARFVMTHRDPLKIIPSVASLQYRLHCERCDPDKIDKHAIGATALWFWAQGMRRGLAARAKIGEHRFIDVMNVDVVSSPIAVFERIYDHLEMELTPQISERLAHYRKENAPGAFGTHRYTLEEYGLTAEGVRAVFRGYIDRFLETPGRS
jgi:hypothetical protein